MRIENTRLRLASFESWKVESTVITISLSQKLWNSSAPGFNLRPSSSRNESKDSSKENTSRDQMPTEKHTSTWRKKIVESVVPIEPRKTLKCKKQLIIKIHFSSFPNVGKTKLCYLKMEPLFFIQNQILPNLIPQLASSYLAWPEHWTQSPLTLVWQLQENRVEAVSQWF